jgi:DNA-binding Lrp family transcriptional regulator
VDTLITVLAKPSNIPFYSDGPRILDRIGALLRAIDQGNFPPTAPQRELARELAAELRAAIDRVQQLLGRTGIL